MLGGGRIIVLNVKSKTMIPDDLYKTIKAYALLRMRKTKDPRHDDKHVERVKNNALKIIKILGKENEIDRNLLKTICLLHDLTFSVRKSSIYTYIFEGHLERKLMFGVLAKFGLSNNIGQTIVDAVYHHSHSFPFRRLNKDRGLYTKILQDADTLDFFNQIRLKIFINESDKRAFADLRRKLGNWLINYGRTHLARFLNYPNLAKSYDL